MHSFDGVNLKIVRVKEQIEAFRRDIELFHTSKPKPCEIIPHGDTKGLNYSLTYCINRHPPKEWGVLAGEIAYNLRSALDHLAWQLALLKTNNPSRSTEFPIFYDQAIFNDPGKGVKNKWKDIPLYIRPTIEKFQPYNRGKWPELELLWCLHEINRIDKHREIIPCFLQPRIGIKGEQFGTFQPMKLNDGDTITVLKSEGTAKLKIMAEIAFDVPDFSYLFPAMGFLGIYKFISDEVIPRFKVFFK